MADEEDVLTAVDERRKHHALSHHAPSATRSITDAVVLKEGEVYAALAPDGGIPLHGEHGFGLYWRDMRWLDGYELRLDGRRLDVLYTDTHVGGVAVFQLSSPGLVGGRSERSELGLRWTRAIDGDAPGLRDELRLHNYGAEPVDVELILSFRAGIDDVFVVRGLLEAPPERLVAPGWDAGSLRFRRLGVDGLARAVDVRFGRRPDSHAGGAATFRLRLPPGAEERLHVAIDLTEGDRLPAQATAAASAGSPPAEELRARTAFTSESEFLTRMVEGALADLDALRTRSEHGTWFAAGLPWFGALFGRDSAITAMQVLAWEPSAARDTLHVLSRLQGTRRDHWRDEEPGKILHELRRGELARAGEIPHTPWYGSVDATPLFLCLVDRMLAWTGDRALFDALRPSVDAALGWLDAATAEDGFVRYTSARGEGLVNQAWKDSGDAIVNDDGTLAEPPIACVEVQGYVFRAWCRMAAIFGRFGDLRRARRLRARAERLRRRIREAFALGAGDWALALQRGGRPCRVRSSNPGHLLWCGVLDGAEAGALANRLLAPDLFGGWGIRTLSTRERRYNPVGYHLGTVWPHDNAIIAAGLRRSGLDDAATRVCDGVLGACTWFPGARLPELYAGFGEDELRRPVPYPVACHPQAWGAGSVLSFLHTLLGLVPDALAGRLRVIRPRLPAFVDTVTLRGLVVGEGRADLAFRRVDGRVEAEVLAVSGRLRVEVE